MPVTLSFDVYIVTTISFCCRELKINQQTKQYRKNIRYRISFELVAGEEKEPSIS